jgi:hypothetical protein
MQSEHFRRSVASNELHRCSNKSCGRLRVGVNAWCQPCLMKARRLGHPQARALRPKQWAAERQAVAALLATNEGHPGLRSALDLLTRWSAKATANEAGFKGAREVARVARHGASSLDILTEVAAFHVWIQRNPHGLPDQRARDFALSRAVFQLAPMPRRMVAGPQGRWRVSGEASTQNSYTVKPMPSGLAYVGSYLREVLAPLLANIAHSIEQQHQHQADLAAAMRAPLRAPEAA